VNRARRIAALLAFVVCATGLAREARAQDSFELTLLEGWARAITEHGAHWLTPTQPALVVEGGVYIELGPDCRLEVVDAGRGSAEFSGTTSAEFARLADGDASLALRRFDGLQLHTLRGALDVTLPGGQRLEFGRAVTHLVGTADGRTHVQHLLGDPLELDLGGWYTFELAVGTRRELPAPLSAGPAPRRSGDFAALRERASATPAPGSLVPNRGVRMRGGLDDSIRSSLWGWKDAAGREWMRFRRAESGAPAGF